MDSPYSWPGQLRVWVNPGHAGLLKPRLNGFGLFVKPAKKTSVKGKVKR